MTSQDPEKTIVVIGMACRYPDANDYNELWDNILSRRRAFRKLPEVRLSGTYFSSDPAEKDKIYSRYAAVLKNYFFDRKKFRISGSNFRTTDLTHWLALDVASQSLQDAGLMNGKRDKLPKKETSVFVGNTLTGEFSRANLMRIRWPYVAKVVAAQLEQSGWDEQQTEDFLHDLEFNYKSSFPEMEEDSLAGGLSNTIAGRICNYFDFKGGGYTVDGACSSSLLAIINACNAVEAGQAEVALAGGVDLSLDPFELVGFSRTGALSKSEMMVYDKNANGFWPGEGCAFVVLTNMAFAVRHQLNIIAEISGWGISSDGQGGLTRPTVKGQLLAMQRAYKKAGYLPSDVHYFEGHGTGTTVGDKVELTTIINAIKSTSQNGVDRDYFVGSIKSNIGHTKAAAGIAGFLKTLLTVKHRIIPPVAGLKNKHPLFEEYPFLVPSSEPLPFEAKNRLRASVSAMGFGGINSHITVQEPFPEPKTSLTDREKILSSTFQDAELFLFSASSQKALLKKVENVGAYAGNLSFSELTDLSICLYNNLQSQKFRAAVIAHSPQNLKTRLNKLVEAIRGGEVILESKNSLFFYYGNPKKRVGFLFPGQGSKVFQPEGLLTERFSCLGKLPDPSFLDCVKGNLMSTAVAQPALAGTSIVAAFVMKTLGIEGVLGLGHSLGEISALFWSGAIDDQTAFRIAKTRGEIMESSRTAKGKMLSIALPQNEVTAFLKNTKAVISGINSPTQTVVSGDDDEINSLKKILDNEGHFSMLLKVENAFHSPKMLPVKEKFADALKAFQFSSPSRNFISTVTGKAENNAKKIKAGLIEQLTRPVRFLEAVRNAEAQVDCWVELGAGTTLERLVESFSSKPVASLLLDGNTVKGLLNVTALTWVLGNQPNLEVIFGNRFSRPFDLNWNPAFISNPCEAFEYQMPVPNLKSSEKNGKSQLDELEVPESVTGQIGDLADQFRQLVAAKLELPVEHILPEHKMLEDLHLNSLSVGQLIAKFASSKGISMTGAPTEYANASISEITAMLENHQKADLTDTKSSLPPPGLNSWVHVFELEMVPATLPLNSGNGTPQNIDENKIYIADLCGLNEKESIKKLCEAIKTCQTKPSLSDVVILQDKSVASGFAKSLFLEIKNLNVLVLNVEKLPSIEVVQAEVSKNKGFNEVFYRDGERYVRHFSPVFDLPENPVKLRLTKKDVIVVSGGGKGITAECAFALAAKYGARLALLGRSSPKQDGHLRDNLARFEELGTPCHYYPVDISDPEAVRKTIRRIEKELGTITGFIHGAGINRPVPVTSLDEEKIRRTLAPKLEGFRNVTAHIGSDNLKFAISFGSIIARSGMEGNADYALANEWLRNEVEQLDHGLAHCRCLNIEWSVWSGAGMGENLGVLENLLEKGIQPIPLEKGVEIFMNLVDRFPKTNNLIVSGRYGATKTLMINQPDLPLLRFLENTVLFYPGIELITEFDLALQTDLYLEDHIVEGEYVFPAVMGLEAMLQAASVIGTDPKCITFSNVEFRLPIVAGPSGKEKVRIIVEKQSDGHIHTALRTGSSGFGKDHFKATITVEKEPPKAVPFLTECNQPQLDVDRDLYSNILFHKGRFRRIITYDHLTPYHCRLKARSAEIASWFNPLLPSGMLLGDPGIRDTMLHAVQACVPEFTLLPTGAEKILIFSRNNDHEIMEIEAVELCRKGDIFHYDIYLRDREGQLAEIWKNATFRILSKARKKYFPTDLAMILIQRRIDELTGHKDQTIVYFNQPKESFEPLTRYDGKPLLKNAGISNSLSGRNHLVSISKYKTGCDIEEVPEQDIAEWKTLLGQQRFDLAKALHSSSGESVNIAATRVWGAMECMKKAGLDIMAAITIDLQEPPELTVFSVQGFRILSYKLSFAKEENPKIISVLLK